MGCDESKPAATNTADHKQKATDRLSKAALERLDRENKLFRGVTSLNQLNQFDQSIQLIQEYYKQIKKCKGLDAC